MSNTYIYTFNKEGYAELYGNIKNAFRGALQIWIILEKKYLPKLPIPEWYKFSRVADKSFYSRTSEFDEKACEPIWNLAYDDRLTEEERIVLQSTFDDVVVKKEYLPKVIKAFENFTGDTSLKEQAEILKKALNDDDAIAVAWNQNSMMCGVWEVAKNVKKGEHEDWDEKFADKNGECTVDAPYNLFQYNKHWFMFEEKQKQD